MYTVLRQQNLHRPAVSKLPCLFISPHQVSLQEQWLWNLLHCSTDTHDASGCDLFTIIYTMRVILTKGVHSQVLTNSS